MTPAGGLQWPSSARPLDVHCLGHQHATEQRDPRLAPWPSAACIAGVLFGRTQDEPLEHRTADKATSSADTAARPHVALAPSADRLWRLASRASAFRRPLALAAVPLPGAGAARAITTGRVRLMGQRDGALPHDGVRRTGRAKYVRPAPQAGRTHADAVHTPAPKPRGFLQRFSVAQLREAAKTGTEATFFLSIMGVLGVIAAVLFVIFDALEEIFVVVLVGIVGGLAAVTGSVVFVFWKIVAFIIGPDNVQRLKKRPKKKKEAATPPPAARQPPAAAAGAAALGATGAALASADAAPGPAAAAAAAGDAGAAAPTGPEGAEQGRALSRGPGVDGARAAPEATASQPQA